MNQVFRLTRWLAATFSLAVLAVGIAPAQNTNSSTTQENMNRQIERGTRRCLRDARREYDRCRRRAHGNRARLARCRRAYHEARSACSG
jgi:hypothetical protein